MTRSNAIDSVTLQDVLSHYDFYQGTIDELITIPQRLTNLNARFRIADRQWVIKRYTDSNTQERLALSHQVQRLLDACHFPVARLEQTREGATLVQRGEDFYSVHTWVSGVHIDGVALYLKGSAPDVAIIEEIAHSLGNYHRYMREHFAGAAQHAADGTLEKIIRQPAGLALRIRQKRQREPLRELWRKCKPNKNDFERWLKNAAPLLAQADALALIKPQHFQAPDDLIVAHNDLNWENLIFDERQRLKAVIDFDNVVVTHRMFEVGAACVVFAGSDTALRQRFLDAYCTSAGMDLDMNALEVGMKIKCLKSVLWSVWAYLNGNIVDHAMLADWCTFLTRCLEDINEFSVQAP